MAYEPGLLVQVLAFCQRLATPSNVAQLSEAAPGHTLPSKWATTRQAHPQAVRNSLVPLEFCCKISSSILHSPPNRKSATNVRLRQSDLVILVRDPSDLTRLLSSRRRCMPDEKP